MRTVRKVAIITGASEGIEAGLVAGYRGRGWAVVASAGATGPSPDPDLLAVPADITGPAGPAGWLPPLGRAGQVSDVVDGVLFLESAGYITGEILHVDGGHSAGCSGPLD
jgi:NAD(P)-dependent dehydrogenase (short-subunit alcohol dehydrogenase family)